jgi:hypothetical protein
MSGAVYEIWIGDPRGRRLKQIDRYEMIEATKVTNDIGAAVLTLPTLYDDYIKLDAVIEVWRKPENGALSLFDAYLLRGWTYSDMGEMKTTTLNAVSGNDLLRRRIVAYDAGSTSTSMTGAADDLMKTVVTENCSTGATDTARDWSGYGFAVGAAQTAGQSVTLGFAYRNVLAVCQDLANASREAGTRLYFDVTPGFADDNTMTWTFNTTPNQPAVDRTGANQVLFGTQFGNLENVALSYDYTMEATAIYSGGSGIESGRIVEEVEDTTRTKLSPWARVEGFYNCSGQASDTAAVYAAGQAELSTMRPLVRMSGSLKDGKSTRFGLHWNFGDKVVVATRGIQLNAVVNAVHLQLYGNGDEIVQGRFEVVP